MDELDAFRSYVGVAHQTCRETTIGQNAIRAHERSAGEGPERLHRLKHLIAARIDDERKA